ncbi:hypothetical protein IDJ75_00625 [Mucilaginibacter rigui]|uniref:Uncharacterized protein n=1 Tax=Mucilaginibacter rigui TaxID=534635 RepID=A0ABR7X1A1_9SPHI|nr:hypothetical protein [Mucilaginibacter rigui]MBD1383765.1 hypothetical protein [Mucilaginibacter rigui]
MKKRYPKSTGTIFKLCIVLLIACVAVIYGCRKDISKLDDNPTATITDPKIAKAKSWYETNYSKPGGKPTTQNTNAVGDDFDLSQFFSPNWAAAKNYARFNDDVIEMPMDAASAIGLKVGSASQSNSRSSVLILKRGDTYKAYVMTIVGYPEYLNADTSKLANNSYGKHDANFSGMVYYTTPQGEFVDGYTYKNGVIKGQLVDNYTATTTGGQAVQSITPNAYQAIQVCTAWYQKVGEVWVYLDTQCHTEVIEVPDPSTPLPPITPPSSGGGGGGGDSPGSPDPCPPQGTVQSVKDGKVGNALKVMLLNPGDGGFPPPGGGGAPCTIKPVEDPCDKLKKSKAKFADSFNTQRNAAILTQPGPHEFGSDLNLTSLTSNTYVNTPITTDSRNDLWTPHFTWNSTDGYTVGSAHKHPGGNAPSPDDVFLIFQNLLNPALTSTGASNINFYKQNAYATVITSTATYVITVNSTGWGQLGSLYANFDNDPDGFDNNYLSIARDYKIANNVDDATATAYALNKIFGDAINMYKAPAGTTSYAIAGIDQDGKLVVVPCP